MKDPNKLSMSTIHPLCKPIAGRESLAAIRDALLSNPLDPYGGLHWVMAYGDILSYKCDICGKNFVEGDAWTSSCLN